ncbi:MAG TPA: hypothetical protein VK880_02260 [Anaerolineales bacterium]|nr:hypothetical protein [Anaerolineales bacterium]
MKRIPPLFIVMLVAFLVAACGSTTPTATQEPTQPAVQPTASEVPSEPAMTEAPTEAAATEPVPVTGGTQVDITLADNTIDASMTSFQVGVPYTFVITNTGQRAHNFNINPPVSVAGSPDQALDSALLIVPQEQLAPGQTATVEFTFPDTADGQLLEFSCLIRRHYDDGMKVDITVTQ